MSVPYLFLMWVVLVICGAIALVFANPFSKGVRLFYWLNEPADPADSPIVFFDGDEILEIASAVAIFVQAAATTITAAIGITPCGVLIWRRRSAHLTLMPSTTLQPVAQLKQ